MNGSKVPVPVARLCDGDRHPRSPRVVKDVAATPAASRVATCRVAILINGGIGERSATANDKKQISTTDEKSWRNCNNACID